MILTVVVEVQSLDDQCVRALEEEKKTAHISMYALEKMAFIETISVQHFKRF